MSAKTDDLINALFLKVTAEALGVKVTHAELDKAATVVKADIVRYRETSTAAKQPEQKRTRSSFCTVQ